MAGTPFNLFLCGILLFNWATVGLQAQTPSEAQGIERWISLLKGSDAGTREAACLKLSKLGPKAKAAIPALVDVVQNSDTGFARVYALSALYHIGRDAVPALMSLLNDPKKIVRQEAFETLKQMGPVAQSAVPALTERLKDKDSANRRQAIEVLGSIGTKAEPAIPALTTILEEQENAVAALTALENIGVAAVPALIGTLSRGKNGDARRWAAVALGGIGLPGKVAAIPALAKALHDSDASVRAYSAKSLSEFGPHARGAVGALIEALGDEETGVRKYSALALGKIGPAARAANDALTKALKSEASDVQLAAAWALTQVGPEAKSIPELVHVVRTGHPWAATHAVRAMVLIGPQAKEALVKEVVPLLIDAVKGDDTFSRSQAMVSLMEVGPDANAAVEVVCRFLKNGNSDEKLNAIGVLGEIGPKARASVPDLIDIIKEVVADDQDRSDFLEACEIRNEAAWALGRIGKDAQQAAPILRALLVRESSPYFRRRAMDALRLIESGQESPRKNP